MQSPFSIRQTGSDNNKENEKALGVGTAKPTLPDDTSQRLFDAGAASESASNESSAKDSQTANGYVSQQLGIFVVKIYLLCCLMTALLACSFYVLMCVNYWIQDAAFCF